MWPQKPNLQQCLVKLEELFTAVQPASIQADVDSLIATYEAVIDNVFFGSYVGIRALTKM
jgi:hypothetical protein